MSAADLYERINAATCNQHGFSSDDEREQHVRAIVETVLRAKGLA